MEQLKKPEKKTGKIQKIKNENITQSKNFLFFFKLY